MKAALALLCLLGSVSSVYCASSPVNENWLNYLVPLPKQIRIEGTLRLTAQDIVVRLSANATDIEQQAAQEIEKALFGEQMAQTTGEAAAPPARTSSTTKPKLEIVLGLCNPAGQFRGRKIPEAAALCHKRNAEQAYCIVPEGRSRLLITALAPQGLYYGAVTMSQLLEAVRHLATKQAASPQSASRAALLVPLVRIVDWPDLAERGVWGGYAIPELEWMASLKMNLIETHATLKIDEAGNGTASFEADLVTKGRKHALKVVPIITHLDQLHGSGIFSRYPQLRGVGPKAKLSESLQAVCFSQPLATKLLSDWATELARNPEITDICIWLSEDPGYCACEQCQKSNQFVLETRACIAAWRAARQINPRLKMRILLTQGSYKDNDKVLAEIPPDVNVTYYHGGLTYDSSREPMIYPLLEEYVKKGRWLGVYPQLTASWRIVCPFSSPQFVKFRMTEFVDKGLTCLCGYMTPNMRLWPFNVEAAAEWSWNAHGRTEREFALAWATRRGLSAPQKAAEWALTLGDVSWDVYGSRIPYSAFFGEAGNMIKNRQKPVLGKGMYRYFESEEKLQQSLRACEKAARLAQELQAPDLIAETQAVWGYVKMLDLLQRIAQQITADKPPTDAERQKLQDNLLALALAGEDVKAGLRAWAQACLPGRAIGGRFNDTLDVTDATVATVSESLKPFGVRNPLWPYIRKRVGGWKDEDFETKERITKIWEVTDYIFGPGEYRVELSHERGYFGITGYSVALTTIKAEQSAGTADSRFPEASALTLEMLTKIAEDTHTSIIGYSPREPVYVLKLTEYHPHARYFLVADIQGTRSSDKPPERRGCQGNVHLWKVRQPDEPIEQPPLLPMSDTEKARYGGPKFQTQGLHIGVLQGGYGSESLGQALRGQEGWEAQPVWLINDKNVQDCHVLIVTQPRAGSALSEAAAKAAARFVERGGGLIATHDAVGYRNCPALLPQIGRGVEHIRVAEWLMKAGHPLAAGLPVNQPLKQSYYDVIVLEPGPEGTIVGTTQEGKPVIVCGEYGKGRAVLCGLGMAFSAADDSDCPPTEHEKSLLLNMIRWSARQL